MDDRNAASAVSTYTVLLMHALGEPAAGSVITRELQSACRLVPVRPCPDCCAVPATTRPPDGYHAAVIFQHEPTCPMMRQALRRRSGESA
ncbi:MAG TPA: hypothetical protein VMV92_44345 [Streptosporangiaceae bacterium]|nr:hypothetical protein [Streptosporangiaceae bacterium]HVB44871.1 hypothetical protein [Streptosporangiaceae bacterium]